ncbi:MAG: PPC domain-containing protein [Myxococcota bacterium]
MNLDTLMPEMVELPFEAMGESARPGDEFFYAFTLPADRLMFAEVSLPEESTLSPDLTLLERDQLSQLQRTFDEPTLTFYTASERDVLLSIVDLNNNTGPTSAFTLNVRTVDMSNAITETEPNDDAETAMMMQMLPLRVSGTLEPDNSDWYAITLEAGDRLVALTSPGASMANLDTVLALVDANGIEVALDDDGGERAFSNLGRIDIPESGTYYLRVEGLGQANGDYTLFAFLASAP